MLDLIANDAPLGPERRDHALKGAWANHRECHVGGNFLLVYQVDDAPKPTVRSTSSAPTSNSSNDLGLWVLSPSAALESDVVDHLYSFFRRYYSGSDFLAKRVYHPARRPWGRPPAHMAETPIT